MNEEPARRSCPIAWTVTIAVIPLVYVLGFGPVVYLQYKPIMGVSVLGRIESIYKPVYWLCDGTPLKAPLGAYRQWWADLAMDGDPFRPRTDPPAPTGPGPFAAPESSGPDAPDPFAAPKALRK